MRYKFDLQGFTTWGNLNYGKKLLEGSRMFFSSSQVSCILNNYDVCDTSHFIYPFVSCWPFGQIACFSSYFLRNTSAVFVQVFLWTYTFFLPLADTEKWSFWVTGSSRVTVSKPCRHGFQSPSTMLYSHQQCVKLLVLATSLPTLNIACLFSVSIPGHYNCHLSLV